ncbi:hypothetical protein GCM10023213_32110 [Prosthecobacter algae]|uniref:Cytochrome c domain-containing protein n=1 Tax=Prosthecobacter algae TaxID=1144682 RepID=A0ABP9PG02_9BACT
MKAASRLLLVAALMISIGLHWAVVQSVAWVGMAVTYSVKTGSVVQGLSDTFDGEHACPLCHAVEEGTQKSSSEKDPAPSKILKDLKLHLAVTTAPVFVFEKPAAPEWMTTSQTGDIRALTPEPLPPRSGLLA